MLIIKYLIPNWYKDKYYDKVGNRKHASGYWWQFIKPRQIAYIYKGSELPDKLYRWFNFYITIKHKH